MNKGPKKFWFLLKGLLHKRHVQKSYCDNIITIKGVSGGAEFSPLPPQGWN